MLMAHNQQVGYRELSQRCSRKAQLQDLQIAYKTHETMNEYQVGWRLRSFETQPVISTATTRASPRKRKVSKTAIQETKLSENSALAPT
jgi:hypothetical protein